MAQLTARPPYGAVLDTSAPVQRNETYKSWFYWSHTSTVPGMDVRQRIGWNLRRLRKEREITQENFATDCGIDRGYISGVERGVRNPSVTVLVRIAAGLGVDVAELFDKDKAQQFIRK